MNEYVIYQEFGKLKLTSKENYYSYTTNASKVIDCSKFESVDSLQEYLIREWKLLPNQIIDRTTIPF